MFFFSEYCIRNPKQFYAHNYAMYGYLHFGNMNFMPLPLSGVQGIVYAGCLFEIFVTLISSECMNRFFLNLVKR